MADILFTNNASSLLAVGITASDDTIQVGVGDGANFPSPTGSQYFYATLEDDTGDIEIVKITQVTGDVLYVEGTSPTPTGRGQDGTIAQAFDPTVTRIELRLTAAVIEELLQVNGGTLTGNVNVNQNELQDAVLTGANTQLSAGEIAGVPLRGSDSGTANEIVVPAAGGAPTIGGTAIVKASDDIEAQMIASGTNPSFVQFDPVSGMRLGQTSGGGLITVYDINVDGESLSVTHTGTAGTGQISTTNATPLTLNPGGELRVTAGKTVNFQDNDFTRANFKDFSVDFQSVTATSSTTINYTAGSYVKLALGTDITTFAISNPPANTTVGTMRLKITQGAGGQTIDWTNANVKWPSNGTAPTLSSGAGDVDFVDLWTDDAGETWYGLANTDWA